MLETIRLLDLRGYASLDATFGPGPHLVWGPNAAGKTSLLEAMALLAWGRSHRTSADGELIRWGTDLARVEGRVGADTVEVAIVRAGATGSAGRKRIRVNGLPRRAAGLAGILRIVLFAPEEMLLIAGSPSLRRAVIDQLAASGSPAYADAFATYARTLQQRNSLLRAIREEGAGPRRAPVLGRRVPRLRAAPSSPSGGACSPTLAGPLAAAHAEIAPDEAAAGPADPALRDERPATPRRVAAGRPRPAPGRDGRQGGLERLHARRAASRRPGVRAGRPGPGHVRLARPAADGDPGPQARRARRGDRPGRPPAPPAPRRRLLRARPGAPVAPRAPDRGPAPGLRDDDHARRPRPGAARDRDGLGGARPGRPAPSSPPPADAVDAVRP